MISVSTNTTALTAQRYLNANSNSASSSIAKMSSGSRIVKAGDDAASLAISNKLRADISTLQQASRNASQGASLVQVATGGLSQIGDILNRMKTLSTQVVNGTLSVAERQFAQQEFSQLRTQVGDISNQTRVNGIAVLNGGDKTIGESTKQAALVSATADIVASNTTLTAGAHFATTAVSGITGYVEGQVTDITTTDLGAQTQIDMKIGNQTFRGVVAETAATGTAFEMISTTNNNNKFTLTTATGALTGAAATQTDMRAVFNVSSATVSAVRFEASAVDEAAAAALINGGTTLTSSIDASGVTVDGNYSLTTKFTAANATTGAAESLEYRLEGQDGKVYTATLEDEVTGTANSLLQTGDTKTLKFGNGVEITVTAAASATATTTAIGSSAATSVQFSVGGGASTNLTFQVGEKSSDTIAIALDAMKTSSLGLDGLNIETSAGGQTASDTISNAINKVNSAVANLGAVQSRLDYIQSNLATVTENLQAANGVFKDVDMAKEMTDFTKSQTLMQAGISMLSQANQMPQLLMRLIQ
jgi:flagellin